jgi:hypothetical protein
METCVFTSVRSLKTGSSLFLVFKEIFTKSGNGSFAIKANPSLVLLIYAGDNNNTLDPQNVKVGATLRHLILSPKMMHGNRSSRNMELSLR